MVESIDDAMELKRWLGERHDGPLGIDTESGGLSAYHHRLRLVQVGDKYQGWAIPWERWGGVALEVMEAWEGSWVAHNSIFDYQFLSRHTGFNLPWHRLHDTLTMGRLEDPTRANGLKRLGNLLVDRNASAGQRALEDGMSEHKWTWDTVPLDFPPYWAYSALDPVITTHLYEYFSPLITSVCPDAYDLELSANRICTNMMMKGMFIDVPYVEKAISDFSSKADEIRGWLKHTHDISSPKSGGQIGRAFERLGQEILFWTDKGAPQFDKNALLFYQTSGVNPAVQQVVKYIRALRHLEDLSSRYLTNFLEQRDSSDVIHCNINVMGARTGRMSVSGPALQQLPRDDKVIRGSFVPRPGHVFVTCDLDQVEARMAAHFSGDEGLIAAFHEADHGGDDFFCGVASGIFGEPISKGDQRRQLTKNTVYGCVPLDYQILTKRGWLYWDQVCLGDETIGYDPAIKNSAWTKITKVHHYPHAELMRIGHHHQSYVTTPNHRWFGSRRVRSAHGSRMVHGYFTSAEISDETRILLGAPLAETMGPDITDDEAAVLGWMLSDGELRVNYAVGGTSQSHGAKRMVRGLVRQSLKKHAHVIDDLFARLGIPHRRYSPDPRQPDYFVWDIHGPWVRDLIQRAGSFYDEWPDAAVFASSLSATQANAMLRSMRLADGDTFIKTKQWQIDLVMVLTYMAGRLPAEQWCEPDEYGWGKKRFGRVRHNNPVLTGQKLQRERVADAPAWCVTTDLGTWTMKVPMVNGSRIVLTGNSIYGAGAETMAQTAGVSVDVMRPVKDAFDARFPDLKRMSDSIIREARNYDRPTTFTMLGRPLIADAGREHTQLPNAKIQGSAAEYMKMCLIRADSAGLGEFFVLPIHDEILMEVPTDQAEWAARVLEEAMTDKVSYKVPMTASAKILTERWVKS